MQLTLYTDYSLRVLLYLELHPEGATVSEIATSYNISRNHLVKIVHHLGQLEMVSTTRGRGGGLRLARQAAEINLGEVVRMVEPNFHLVECFDKEKNRCTIAPVCTLKHVLMDAQSAFLATLDRYTLADLVRNKNALLRRFEGAAPLAGKG